MTEVRKYRDRDLGADAPAPAAADTDTADHDRNQDAALTSGRAADPTCSPRSRSDRDDRATLEADAGTAENRTAGMCARCGDAPEVLDAPGVHTTEFGADAKLCEPCFRALATESAWSDTINDR